MSEKGTEPVEIGVIARAHGVRGELRVHLHNPGSDVLGRADSILIGADRFAIESIREVNQAFLIRVGGVADRNAAELLKAMVVSVDRDCLELEDDDILLVDMVGLRAVLPDGSDWGEVVAIEPGPQDRLVVRQDDIERQLPIVDAFVLSVDLEAGTVLVDPPEDLPEADA